MNEAVLYGLLLTNV